MVEHDRSSVHSLWKRVRELEEQLMMTVLSAGAVNVIEDWEGVVQHATHRWFPGAAEFPVRYAAMIASCASPIARGFVRILIGSGLDVASDRTRSRQ
jgi:hypothetical protein